MNQLARPLRQCALECYPRTAEAAAEARRQVARERIRQRLAGELTPDEIAAHDELMARFR